MGFLAPSIKRNKIHACMDLQGNETKYRSGIADQDGKRPSKGPL
jgi:hypothetical protein